MQDELLRLWDDTQFTVLFVTHSIAEAIKIGNRILLLSPHPGRVKAEMNAVDKVSAEDGTAAELEKQHPRASVRRWKRRAEERHDRPRRRPPSAAALVRAARAV